MDTKKERIVSSLFTVMCALLLIGYVITVLLRVKPQLQAKVPSDLGLLPTIICMVISTSIGIFYLISRTKYFVSIRLHVNQKWFTYEYIAVGIFLTNCVMTLLLLLPIKTDDFQIYAPFLCIAAIIILNIVAVGLHEYSVFKIKVDREKRLLGEQEESDDKDSKKDKEEKPSKVEPSNTSNVEESATAGKFYE